MCQNVCQTIDIKSKHGIGEGVKNHGSVGKGKDQYCDAEWGWVSVLTGGQMKPLEQCAFKAEVLKIRKS